MHKIGSSLHTYYENCRPPHQYWIWLIKKFSWKVEAVCWGSLNRKAWWTPVLTCCFLARYGSSSKQFHLEAIWNVKYLSSSLYFLKVIGTILFTRRRKKDQFYGNNNIPNMFIDWYTYYDYIYLIMLCCITLYSINYINTENILWMHIL